MNNEVDPIDCIVQELTGMEPEASTEPPQSTDYTYLYDRLTTLKTHQASITRDIASIEYKLGISKDARTEWKCLRCHHRWQGGSLPPTRCQRCKSPCWFKAPRTMRDRHPEDKPAKSWYKPTGRPRGRPPGTPNKRVYFATPVEVPTQPGPSQLPPLDLPRLGNAPAARAPANLAASAASLPPLPAPSVPLPAPTYEYHLYSSPARPLAERLRQLSQEPPQPEHSSSFSDEYMKSAIKEGNRLIAEEIIRIGGVSDEPPAQPESFGPGQLYSNPPAYIQNVESPTEVTDEPVNIETVVEGWDARMEERPSDLPDVPDPLSDDLPDDTDRSD